MRRRLPSTVLVGLLVAVLASALLMQIHRPQGALGDLLWRVELTGYDWRLRTRAVTVPPELVIVAIDPESLSQLNVWPWPRIRHAQLLNRLTKAGAAVVGMDVVFDSLSGNQQGDQTAVISPNDRALAQAVRKSGHVILAGELVEDQAMRGQGLAAGTSLASFPHEVFADVAHGIGLVNVPRDADATVRRFWLTLPHQDEPYPTFPVAIAAAYLHRDPLTLARQAAMAGEARHPYLGGDSLLVNYSGPPGTIKRYPYYQVLSGRIPASAFRGKIVLIGPTADLLQDVHPTPLASATLGQSRVGRIIPMPGVEVQANAVSTLLHRSYLRPLPLIWVLLLSLFMACVMSEATVLLRPLRALPVLIGLLLLGLALSLVGLWLWRLWVPLTPALGSLLLAYVVMTVYMYLVEERARLRLRQAWQKRVSAEVLRIILNTPDMEKVGGRRVVATVMFADLRGFTAFCHDHAPEVVVETLNEYLTAMTEVIRKHGGTVHKFIGDGIMAVFGDPVPGPDHADRALRAALEMQERMLSLGKDALARGQQTLPMGVALHTGELVAGDIGSEALLEYTVIGDTVSTASRIEALNKEHGTSLLLSGQTKAALIAPDLALTYVATQTVRGRDEDLELYTVGDLGPTTVTET